MATKICLFRRRSPNIHHKVNDEYHIRIVGQTLKNNNSSIEELISPCLPDTVAMQLQNPHQRVGLEPSAEQVGGRS